MTVTIAQPVSSPKKLSKALYYSLSVSAKICGSDKVVSLDDL